MSKYNSPSYGIHVKTIRDWKYCSIRKKKMYSASVAEITILSLIRTAIKKPFPQLQPACSEVNDFKGGYEPEGSGSLSKTPDGEKYDVQELVDKIAKRIQIMLDIIS